MNIWKHILKNNQNEEDSMSTIETKKNRSYLTEANNHNCVKIQYPLVLCSKTWEEAEKGFASSTGGNRLL